MSDPLAPDDPRHGKRFTYQNYKCRCDLCREAHRAYCHAQHKRRAAALAPDDPRHGKASTYFNYDCRCEPCSEAGTAAVREQRLQKKRGDNS